MFFIEDPFAWKLPSSIWLETIAAALDGGWQQRISRRQARAMRTALERSGAALGDDVERTLIRMLSGRFTISKVGGPSIPQT